MVVATPTHNTAPFRSQSTPKRPPLLPSLDKNAGIPHRTKAREVKSRYLSTSSSPSSSSSNSNPNSSSPLTPRAAPMPAVRRAQSAERRRPATPRPLGEVSEAAKLLLNSSRRSLSVSFQGESYAVPRSSTSSSKIVRSTPMKKGESLRRGAENARPVELPWPRRVNLGSARVSSDATLQKSVNSVASDADSLSSDGDSNSGSSVVCRGRNIVVPPRYLQQRVSEPGSPMARSELVRPRKCGSDSGGASPRGIASNGGMHSRPASPNKLGGALERMSSPGRGMVGRSLVRARNVVASTQSALCFAADVRRMRVGDNRLGDAHLLRLLHNRHLQWRFVNARAGALFSIQQVNVERSIYDAWRSTSDLHAVVSSKRKELQWLRMKLKLLSILEGQILQLEEWALMENDHCSSLSGAIESLKASTIRLQLVSGARADIQELKDAICSAADVMHSMASSICSLLLKVEKVDSLVADVASLSSKEHSFLKECHDTLSMLAAMQIKDSSLRAHILQAKM